MRLAPLAFLLITSSARASLMYEMPPPPAQLGGIAYVDGAHWTLWLAGEEVTAQNPSWGIWQVTEVTPHGATLTHPTHTWRLSLYPETTHP